MTKNKVEVVIDSNTEMLSITVDNECAFFGNFWDFDRPESIVSLLHKLNVDLTVSKRHIDV